MKKIFFFQLLFLIFISCKKDNDTDYLVKNIQYKTLSSVDKDLLSLDIYYQKNTEVKKPIIFYVHGGGWCIGDKGQKLDNKLDLFYSLEYIFVSINYRLSPFPYKTSDPDRIKFPLHNEDIADALRWVYDNIETYGGDRNKMVLLGHSAGAHLVALTGTNKSFVEEVGLGLSNIRGVAVIDTQGYDVGEQIENGSNQEMYINAFGTDEDENVKASPLLHLFDTIDYPKFFIAKRGTSERIAYANEFIQALENNGVSVSQVNGSVYSHAGINEAIGDKDETLVTDPLKEFLRTCFE